MNSRVRNIIWAEDNDDHYILCEKALKDYMSKEGYECNIHRAVDGNAVFRLLISKKSSIDLVVLDIHMPHYNGFQTILDVFEQKLSRRLIVVSDRLALWPEYVEKAKELVDNHIIIGAYEMQKQEIWCEAIYTLLKSNPPSLLHLSDIHFGQYHALKSPLDLEKLLAPKLRERIQEGFHVRRDTS
jgi:CheY-like chemotaxis protein